MQHHIRVALRTSALVSVALLASCASSKGSRSDEGRSELGWIQASPVLQQQIDDESRRLPWTHGFERLEQIRWFASVGEPAYETLFTLCVDPRDEVAAAALAALGATGDQRLVPHIQDLPWSADRAQSDLGLERARTLLRLGDWDEIPTLIAGLKDQRLYTRSLCFDALKESTHETHGYDPRSEEQVRTEAVNRWERWWQSRSGEGLLSAR